LRRDYPELMYNLTHWGLRQRSRHLSRCKVSTESRNECLMNGSTLSPLPERRNK
jgi:hypothetical protein